MPITVKARVVAIALEESSPTTQIVQLRVGDPIVSGPIKLVVEPGPVPFFELGKKYVLEIKAKE